MSRNARVVVAMSGGVDSSVAAALLVQQGFDCVGVFLRVGDQADASRVAAAVELPTAPARRLRHGCCSVTDAIDARTIAGRLGIPFYALNFQADFSGIVDYFVDEYVQARTPNPCVMCNTHLKFGRLLAYADVVGAQYIATGHYARIVERRGRAHLACAANLAKDQSYVLFGIARDALDRCVFPLGEIADKADVRRLAADLGLRVHDKPDSQEICFVPDQDYASLVHARRPDAARPGALIDERGRTVGAHDGIAQFTIGQRRGLGVALGEPRYVTAIDPGTQTVTIGPRDALLRAGLLADQINLLTDEDDALGPDADGRSAWIKLRHQHTPAPGRVRRVAGHDPRAAGFEPRAAGHEPRATGRESRAASGELRAAGRESGAPGREPCAAGGAVEMWFDEPQIAVTPGQAAVWYDESGVVLGGGWIERSFAAPAAPDSGQPNPSPKR